MNTFQGNISPEDDTIFVFGSNPDGIHGAGSAAVAKRLFGAKLGVGVGLQGQSYALPTTDLKKKYRPSIDEETVVKNIVDMYNCASEHPEKKFKIAYRSLPKEVTLCGYSGRQLINMFKRAAEFTGGIPENIYFSQEWADAWDTEDEEN